MNINPLAEILINKILGKARGKVATALLRGPVGKIIERLVIEKKPLNAEFIQSLIPDFVALSAKVLPNG